MTVQSNIKEKQVRTYLLGLHKNAGSGHAFSLVHYADGLSYAIHNQACHYSLAQPIKVFDTPPYKAEMPKSEIIAFGSGFLPNQQQKEIALKFWDFVSDTSISPWRKIFANGVELVVSPKSNLPVGFIIPPETANSLEIKFLKNFCILMRTVTEKFDTNFTTWNFFVENFKVDPRDALYLASGMTWNRGLITYYRELDGWHCALADRLYARLDWDVYFSGDVHSVPKNVVEQVNGYFCKVNSKGQPFKLFDNVKSTVIKGQFSSSSGYNPEDVLDSFYEWKKQNGFNVQ